VKLRVALKIFWWLRKRRTNRQVNKGRMEKGREWNHSQETHMASCLAHCFPCLHFACNSLVCYSVCNCTRPLRHSHLSHASTSQATNKSAHQPQTPPLRPANDQQKAKMSKSPQDSDIYAQLAARDTQPEPLKKVLAREQANYDCLSCRVMGMHFFSISMLSFVIFCPFSLSSVGILY
jgi:hypothetical protein